MYAPGHARWSLGRMESPGGGITIPISQSTTEAPILVGGWAWSRLKAGIVDNGPLLLSLRK